MNEPVAQSAPLKWEYRRFNGDDGQEITLMAQAGEEGWEAFQFHAYYLHGSLPGAKRYVSVYCKRPLQASVASGSPKSDIETAGEGRGLR